MEQVGKAYYHVWAAVLGGEDYEWITREIAELGDGKLPIISVLEGGYNVDQLVKSVRTHLHALIYS